MIVQKPEYPIIKPTQFYIWIAGFYVLNEIPKTAMKQSTH